MRIGIDTRLWNESGVGRYTRNLVKNLQAIDGKNEYVLFVGNRDYQNVKCQMSNVKWKIIQTNIRWHTIEEQLRFPAILNRENLDLVHFPYFSVPIFYDKPFVVTIHDLILHHFPTGEASTLPLPLYRLKLFGYKFIISQAAKKAKKIITVSNATKREVIDHLGVDPSKVIVTYEGVFDNSKLQLKIKNYFLYVGNAYPHKNLDRFIDAFSILISQDPNIYLVLVGKEDYFYKRLKRKVKKMNLERSVLFYGEVSDKELSVLYKNALALVMPSFMEGFGLPALEAMVNNCLVLASDIPALKEICGNAALYFDPLDTQELAKMLQALAAETLEHEKYEKLRKRGIERSKQFSWEKMARETLQIYESCCR